MRAPAVEVRTGGSHPPASPPERALAFGSAWSQLEDEIRSCQRCPLHRTRTHAVIYRGSPSPSVVFVGEAPGATEDRLGLPFMGRSGARLNEAIETTGLLPGAYGVLNVVKCRPPQNRFDRSAALACRPYLERQLDLLRPKGLVPLGAEALRALDPTAPRVMLAAGRPREAGGRSLFPLIHPAAAFRSRSNSARWSTDVGALRSWLADLDSPRVKEPI